MSRPHGYKHSPEARAKIQAKATGRKLPDDVKERIRQAAFIREAAKRLVTKPQQ